MVPGLRFRYFFLQTVLTVLTGVAIGDGSGAGPCRSHFGVSGAFEVHGLIAESCGLIRC